MKVSAVRRSEGNQLSVIHFRLAEREAEKIKPLARYRLPLRERGRRANEKKKLLLHCKLERHKQMYSLYERSKYSRKEMWGPEAAEGRLKQLQLRRFMISIMHRNASAHPAGELVTSGNHFD